MPTYLDDIRSQPAVLQDFLDAGLAPEVKELLARPQRFDRIVMTGMGASFFAHYPTFLELAAAGLPIWSLETSEMLGPAGALVTPRSLLWVTSQSGNSGEVTALLGSLPSARPTVLGVTNDMTSDLALGADVVLELHSGEEQTVSTRSYVNTLAAQALATAAVLGRPGPTFGDLPAQLDAYLTGWDEHVHALERAVAGPTLFIVARGPSLTSARTGALIAKEAAKTPVEGMSTPQFRHGPLELVDADVTVIHLAGLATDVVFNRRMLDDVTRAGGLGLWLSAAADDTDIVLPAVTTSEALPIAEILPLQALTVALAGRKGIEPGAFRHIEKVTRTL